MPKPVAYVSRSVTSIGGHVTIETPDSDFSGHHRALAAAAASLASDGWAIVRVVSSRKLGVSLVKPADRRIGGGALREVAKHVTQDARDEAKAYLRGVGYTVRSGDSL